MELATTIQRGGEGAGGGEDEQPRASTAIFDPAPGSEIAHHPSSAALDDNEGADGEDQKYGDDDKKKAKKVASHQAKLESGGADQVEAGADDESGLGGWNTTFE